MKYIDSHCHLNLPEYNLDLAEVIDKTKNDSVAVINIGTQADTSKKAVQLAEKHDHLWAIIGLHPIYTTASSEDDSEEPLLGGEIFDMDYYRELAGRSSRVVGIGECGLDYYRNTHETKAIQEKAFREQIELAVELDLPLMLHVRPSQGSYDAYEETLLILDEYKQKHPNLRGQAHFFAGTVDIAEQFIKLGFYISFTGVITFAKDYEQLVRHLPLDKMLSETDAPYVSPKPFRGQRNEPSHVREVVKKIAEIREISEEEVAEQIRKSVKELYGFDY